MLFIDFRYHGERCREQTMLPDTPANRKRLEKILAQIEAEIGAGKFDYRRHFPNSKLAEKFDAVPSSLSPLNRSMAAMTQPVAAPLAATLQATPLFSTFADEWFSECEVRWRKSYCAFH